MKYYIRWYGSNFEAFSHRQGNRLFVRANFKWVQGLISLIRSWHWSKDTWLKWRIEIRNGSTLCAKNKKRNGAFVYLPKFPKILGHSSSITYSENHHLPISSSPSSSLFFIVAKSMNGVHNINPLIEQSRWGKSKERNRASITIMTGAFDDMISDMTKKSIGFEFSTLW